MANTQHQDVFNSLAISFLAICEMEGKNEWLQLNPR